MLLLAAAFIIAGLAVTAVFFNIAIRTELRFSKGEEISPASHSLFRVQGGLRNFNLRCFPDFFAKIFHTSVNLEISQVRQCINNPLAELFLCLEYFIDLFLSFNIRLEIDTY